MSWQTWVSPNTASKPLGWMPDNDLLIAGEVAQLKLNVDPQHQAIPFAQRILAIRKKALGQDHPDVATFRYRFGMRSNP
jgi:hypothetical protein